MEENEEYTVEAEAEKEENQKPLTTFTTRSGVVLSLRKINKMALQSLTLQSGLLDIVADGGDVRTHFDKLDTKQQVELSNKMMGVLRFCLMFGVETDPPEDVVEELKLLGCASTPNIARMNWIMGVLEDDREAGLLVAAIKEQ